MIRVIHVDSERISIVYERNTRNLFERLDRIVKKTAMDVGLDVDVICGNNDDHSVWWDLIHLPDDENQAESVLESLDSLLRARMSNLFVDRHPPS